ncbi:MAG: endolytic transglycosylase MltG [Candidatus Saccharibacteria bacterium]
MKNFIAGKSNKTKLPKTVLVSGLILGLIVIGVVVVARRVYMDNLVAVNIASDENVVVAIPSGSSLEEITTILKNKKIIRADWAFKRYVISHDYSNSLKAGTYRFKLSQDTGSIVKDLVNGKVDVTLFTIFPARRLDQIRQDFIDKGFATAEVDLALKPSNYASHPALVDKPASANLEGYLYPDSYQRTADTTVKVLIKSALDEMAKVLTPDVRTSIAKQGISTYQAITIASIVEQEIPSSALEDRRMAAQVFLKRIKLGMQLGSDVTAFYGTAINNQPNSVSYDSPYNTRIHSGYPPSPIGNVSSSGLLAVANPADTDYLYFVAGDDNITYFSRTLAEHDANVAQHCKILCN